MGLISAAIGAAGGVLADQWKEYFYCDALPEDVLVIRGEKRVGGRSSNTKGNDNIISNGSVIAVADGQCMIIVDQGKITEICAEPGEFVYDTSTEPSLFYGSLSESIPQVFAQIGKRFTFGGEPPKDQRVYYFNTKELLGNKFGTPTPVPFRVVDKNAHIDMEIGLRCFGEYSYRITNPILFYTRVCANVTDVYKREQIESQMKSEIISALQPAFYRISSQGVRYYEITGHTQELADALNEELSAKWRDLRGIEIVSVALAGVRANEEDEATIKELQKSAALSNPDVAAGHLVSAQAEAMKAAAANTGAGPMMAFAGMNMAGAAGGINAGNLFAMNAQKPQAEAAAPKAEGWTCSCGASGNTGKFCTECGRPKPSENFWTCECGTQNKGKFCSECGRPKPAGVPQYKCDKCGWEPEDPAHPPKFCPECGDPFDDGDLAQ